MTKMQISDLLPGAAASRGLLLGAALIGLTAFGACATTTRVDAGHIGIRVNLAGSNRGVSDMSTAVGWVFYNPLTQQIVLFPTSVQNVIWSASSHEGRPVDESISFSSSEGVNVSADVALSFRVEPALAPQLYAKFRQNDLNALAYGYLRNIVRDAFNEVASKIPVQQIYGSGKSQMLADVTKRCHEKLAVDGIVIEQLTVNGALRLPQNVADAINRAMEATQNAIQSENTVREVKAKADQSIAKAHGEAEAARQEAQGKADALLIRARAEARANEIIALSITPAVLQVRSLEKWDGVLPTYNAGTLPLLTFDAAKLSVGMDAATRERKMKELKAEDDKARSDRPSDDARGKPAPAPAP